MIVVYSETHLLHSPKKEVWGGRARPHPEVPERAERILHSLQDSFRVVSPRPVRMEILAKVHSRPYLQHLKRLCGGIKGSTEAFPFVFPACGSPPVSPMARRGFFAYDTVTPLGSGTFSASLASASCASHGASLVRESKEPVYCLCRPPGHHAGRKAMAGYCYLNNAAVAAVELRAERLAILDVDSHHGNGTQEIFYRDDGVLFCSIHGDPRTRYPYAWGFKGEIGAGKGEGYNINVPLPGETRGARWLKSIEGVLERIGSYDPARLIVSLGVDGLSKDRYGPLMLEVQDYSAAGKMISDLGYPTCIIQEGGYHLRSVGECTKTFLENWS